MKKRYKEINYVSITIPEKTSEINRVLERLVTKLKDNGIEVSEILPINQIFDDINPMKDGIPQISIEGDIIIVVGGDGTVLKTLLLTEDKEKPILSIGLGELNFIASTDKNTYEDDLEKLFNGTFFIRYEMRLDVKISDLDINLPPVLNEVLYHSSKIGKTLLPRVEVETRGYRETLWSVKSDGVLVSTPIGSTAYSYAAGGPIIDTNLDAIIITPLIPTTKIPSYVVTPDTKILLKAKKSRSSPCIVLDGQIIIGLDWDQEVQIIKSDYPAKIITFSRTSNLIRMKRVAERYGGVKE